MKKILISLCLMFFSGLAFSQTFTTKAPYPGTDAGPDTVCFSVDQATAPTSCTGHTACTMVNKSPMCPLAARLPGLGTWKLHMVYCWSTAVITNAADGSGATSIGPGCAPSSPFTFSRLPQGAPGATQVVPQ